MSDPGTQLGNVEDLGGPTPENYKADDDSAKLKTPSATLKKVSDVVTKGVKEDEDLDDENLISEEESEEVSEDSEEEIVDEIEEEVEEESVVSSADIEEDVNALIDGEELSEEF
jgi:hypothetical protein